MRTETRVHLDFMLMGERDTMEERCGSRTSNHRDRSFEGWCRESSIQAACKRSVCGEFIAGRDRRQLDRWRRKDGYPCVLRSRLRLGEKVRTTLPFHPFSAYKHRRM